MKNKATQHQETEGLLSSFIRNVRLRQVASHLRENSTVLDLACGAGSLSGFLPRGCKYYGVDRIPADTASAVEIMNLDLFDENAFERIRSWLSTKPDYLTCIAFLEHISQPAEFLSKFRRLLDKTGLIIGTTPHPYGRVIHDLLSKLYLVSRSAAQEHETFLGQKDLQELAQASGGRLVVYKRFLFGLNQLFVIEYKNEGP